jgi:uncharacterized membrane protein YfcA
VADILLICALASLAYFVKGVTGAASAIVFNACLLVAFALGWPGDLTLADGLYWLAVADLFSSAIMWAALRRTVKPEPLTVRLLLGMIPTIILFAILLPHVDVLWLSLILSVAVIGAGAWLALRNNAQPAADGNVKRWAFPVGLIAGMLGGLFGMAGPVFFLLLTRASHDPSEFRRRAVLITTVGNVARLVTLLISGAITTKHLVWFGWSVPALLAATALGVWVHRFIPPRPFRVALGVLVALAGVVGLWRYAL